jgi:hypothetical protein
MLRAARAVALATALPVAVCPAVAFAQNAPDRRAVQPGWTFSAAFSGYFVADSSNYLQPTITADRGLAHFEVRYNYEGRETGSAWLGCNFGGGETVAWELVPIFGGVFGATSAVAPGYRGSLSWRALTAYSESEYVFDARDSSDSFLYNWSELTVSPIDWLRFGLVVQRTRAYRSDRDIQRGVLVGVSRGRVELTGDVFNVDESSPTVVVALSLNWE